MRLLRALAQRAANALGSLLLCLAVPVAFLLAVLLYPFRNQLRLRVGPWLLQLRWRIPFPRPSIRVPAWIVAVTAAVWAGILVADIVAHFVYWDWRAGDLVIDWFVAYAVLRMIVGQRGGVRLRTWWWFLAVRKKPWAGYR